ncbi:MAG: glutamyl-tRNA reductase [Acidobacteria bacterium]|nr:glutamyl-tRNA reductase [Acidobacteriota bacterium]MBV9144703.1 glutamyl-tRNA reductase [Acidobacteriota bacterium]MBV9437661.1 glutamyl-tRNA reductase [Acidobacteriota bacterium]
MNLQLTGVNHKTAPIEVRERLAIPEWRLEEATRKLLEYTDVRECVVFSTCNRVEFVLASENHVDLNGFLREYLMTDPSDLRGHLYEYGGDDVVRHVFRVAASLDSMIVGEPQILGQVKHAYHIGKAVGSVQTNLDALLTRALAVAKRVRTETAVGSSAVSVASVAVELAKKIFGSLQGRNVYLVGAGKMSELAARHLRSHGAGAILVSNRTYGRAQQVAERIGGSAIQFERLYETADRADIVITSTGAPHAIFRREHGERFMQRRRNRPMFFIDIAVPRDVDSAMSHVEGIFVYDIDDLQQVVEANVADRGREAERAELLVEEEVARFRRRMQSLDAVPTIVALQNRVERIRQQEIERMRSKLGSLSPEQQIALENLTRGIVNKILHPSVTALKTMTGSEQLTAAAELLRTLFGVEDDIMRRNGTGDSHSPSQGSANEISSSSPQPNEAPSQKSVSRG